MAGTPSKAAHEAILNAFIKLIEKRHIDAITTDAIARAAGASKGTLYKHWANKDELLRDVIKRLTAALPVADSGDFQADAAQVLRNMFVHEKGTPFSRIWPKIIGYVADHPKFCASFNCSLLEHSPRHTLVGIIREAVAAGELRPDLDVEFALDLLAGPLLHHRFVHRSVPAKLPGKMVMAVWPLLKPGREAAV